MIEKIKGGENMRLTFHNGRSTKGGGTFSSKHNDRNFDLKNADHIDPVRQDKNQYWHCYKNSDPNLTFEEAEKKFYTEHFSDFLTARNEKYLKQRHKDKVQTIDDYVKSRKSCPEEIIFAIGNVKDFKNLDTKKITRIYNEFMRWRKEKYPNVVCIDVALHSDEEGVPHIQERVSWIAHDQKGNEMVSQGQALKEMGVPLPFPEKKESRYNNAKVTFTRDCREKFFEICRGYGIEIEEQPKERSEVGLSLTEYKVRQEEQKLQEIQSEMEKIQVENAELKKHCHTLKVMKNSYSEWIDRATKEYSDKNGRLKIVNAELEAGEKKLEKLEKMVSNYDMIKKEYEFATKDFNDLVEVYERMIAPLINLKESEKNNDFDARELAISKISEVANKIFPRMAMYDDIYQERYEEGFQKFSRANPKLKENEKKIAFCEEVVKVHGAKIDKISNAINAVAYGESFTTRQNLMTSATSCQAYKQSQQIGGEGILWKFVAKVAGKYDRWASLSIPVTKGKEFEDEWNSLSEAEKADRRANQSVDNYGL